MDVERICGTCKYHRPNENGDWVCTCVDSDLCGIETEYNYSCMEYDSCIVVWSMVADDSTRIKS